MPAQPEISSINSGDSENSSTPDTFNEDLEARLTGSAGGSSFRKILDPDKFNPMLMAMAHAAKSVPSIRYLALLIGIEGLGGVDVEYLAVGEDGFGGPMYDEEEEGEEERMRKDKKRWDVTLGLESKWKVPEELIDVWKEMGSSQGDGEDNVFVTIDEYDKS